MLRKADIGKHYQLGSQNFVVNIDHKKKRQQGKKPWGEKNRLSWWILLNEVILWGHISPERSWATLWAFQNTFWSLEIWWSAVPDGDGQRCCGGQIYWGLTPRSLLAWSHQPLFTGASSLWMKCSDCCHQPFKQRCGMVGRVISEKNPDAALGPISQKVRTEQLQNSNGERLHWNGHPSVTLLLLPLSPFPFPIVKVSHSEKRIMMCWGRENFPLPQAVKHLSWAMLKCQHKCVLVYRKKSIIIRNHSCYCIS